MKPRLLHSAAMLLLLASCSRDQPTPPPLPATPVAPPPAPVKPVVWTWRPLGNLAIIEGEIPQAAELVLTGPRTWQTRTAAAGLLRWEIIRPPEGERAELRTRDGKPIARFRFETPKPSVPSVAPGFPLAKTNLPSLSSASILAETIPAPAPLAPPPEQRLEPQLRASLDLPGSRRNGTPSWSAPASFVPLAPRTEVIPPLGPLLRPMLPGPRWPGAGEALHLARGPRSGRSLVLSFDGGSSAEVAVEILEALKARRVRTTLFLTGAFIRKYPDLVKRMARDGHELGNHTLSHPHFAPGGKRDPKWTRERVQQELLEADQALYALLGRPMDPFWRAPYGEQTAEIRKWAEEIGYRHVGWSEGADTLDWATTSDRKLYRSGAAILDRMQRRLEKDGNGLIVLMHLGSGRPEEDRPARSLGAFMDRATKDGWRFVPVGTYLKELGKPEWDPLWRVAALKGGGVGLAGGQK
jgi:peptidoglycan/xylan/chitin deacetylase (PgdA/CDA1 family)